MEVTLFTRLRNSSSKIDTHYKDILKGYNVFVSINLSGPDGGRGLELQVLTEQSICKNSHSKEIFGNFFTKVIWDNHCFHPLGDMLPSFLVFSVAPIASIASYFSILRYYQIKRHRSREFVFVQN